MENYYLKIEYDYNMYQFRKKYDYHFNDKYYILDDIKTFKLLYSHKQCNKKGFKIGKIKTKLNYNKKIEFIINDLTIV